MKQFAHTLSNCPPILIISICVGIPVMFGGFKLLAMLKDMGL